MSTAPKTLFEKVWEQHVVAEPKGEPTLLYIDLQLLHEVTSPQAFEGLRLAGRKVRRPDRCIAPWITMFRPRLKAGCNIVDQIAATQIDNTAQKLRGLRRRTLRRGHRANKASCMSSVPNSASPSPA